MKDELGEEIMTLKTYNHLTDGNTEKKDTKRVS